MSSIGNCNFDSQHIQYCLIDGETYVGNNETNAYNNETTPIDITIPKTFHGNDVIYIGSYAFNFYRKLRKVKIQASIIAINRGAFANCPNLEYINIPSSLTFLYDNAIQCYNAGNPSPGVLTVAFDFDSQIQLIGRQLFSYKEFIHIYICDKISPIVKSYVFNSTEVTIYSTSSFSLNNITTTLTYCCAPNILCSIIPIKSPSFIISCHFILASILSQ